MCGHEKPTDPEFLKCRTVFIIMFTDSPIFWVSKLQTKTDLSNMEAEIIASLTDAGNYFPLLTL